MFETDFNLKPNGAMVYKRSPNSMRRVALFASIILAMCSITNAMADGDDDLLYETHLRGRAFALDAPACGHSAFRCLGDELDISALRFLEYLYFKDDKTLLFARLVYLVEERLTHCDRYILMQQNAVAQNFTIEPQECEFRLEGSRLTTHKGDFIYSEAEGVLFDVGGEVTLLPISLAELENRVKDIQSNNTELQ